MSTDLDIAKYELSSFSNFISALYFSFMNVSIDWNLPFAILLRKSVLSIKLKGTILSPTLFKSSGLFNSSIKCLFTCSRNC